MKRIAILTTLAILTALPAGAAQLYRWEDDKGNVEYRDTPPPSSAKKVEQLPFSSGTTEATALPFSVQQAMKNFPVTLWTTNCGGPCDQARAHLARRGVPYTEKDPQADTEAFQKLTGSLEVPVLYVGATRIKGYLENEWDSALDIAGYPRTPPPGAKTASKGAAKPPAELPPVKLYTHPDCSAPCNGARTLLGERGINFEEAVVGETAQFEELEKLSGDLRVPVLVIGASVTRGYSATSYHSALDAAGFARTQPAAKP